MTTKAHVYQRPTVKDIDIMRKLSDLSIEIQILREENADLLAACQFAQDFLLDVEWSEGGGKTYQELVATLEAAIAKAIAKATGGEL